MNLDLSDEETAALTENDRDLFSDRIRTLKAILAQPEPKPIPELLPPPKACATRATAGRTQRTVRRTAGGHDP